MAGPILQSETKVAWASRTESPTFARGDRTHWTPPTSSPEPSSSRIILPLSEHRFADSSPSPFPTSGSLYNRNPQNRFQPPEGTTPSPSSSPGCDIDVDEMRVPGTSDYWDDPRTPNRETVSAPAELHQLHRKITMDTPETKVSLGAVPGSHEHRNPQLSIPSVHSTPISGSLSSLQSTQRAINEARQKESHDFHLDRSAPIRALRHPPESASTGAGGQAGRIMGTIEEQRGQSGTPESMLDPAKKDAPPVVNEANNPERAPSLSRVEGATDKRAEETQTWGEPFKLQWIKTERLPFYRTRHLRNPWNHDREVKVSRDGTELEPSVGQALLDEWDKVVEELSMDKSSQQPGQGGVGGGSRQQGRGKGGGAGGNHRSGKR